GRNPGHGGHPGAPDAVGDPDWSGPLHLRRAPQPARAAPRGAGRGGAAVGRREGIEGAGALMAIFVLFGAVLLLVFVNVPIAISLGVVAVIAIAQFGSFSALANAPLAMYSGATSFPLIAIPLFILAGAIMNASGISRRLIALSSALLGWMR